MITSFIMVALGGAIGASARFGLALALARDGFPVAIIAANVLGSFLMGLFFMWSLQKGMTHLNPLVMTGVLGGFTTFSAFSLEAYTLLERGQAGAAAAYVAISVVASLLALAAGVALARGVLG
ncbi:MAG: CrcB family protein [Pseudomonadota bacterium]